MALPLVYSGGPAWARFLGQCFGRSRHAIKSTFMSGMLPQISMNSARISPTLNGGCFGNASFVRTIRSLSSGSGRLGVVDPATRSPHLSWMAAFLFYDPMCCVLPARLNAMPGSLRTYAPCQLLARMVFSSCVMDHGVPYQMTRKAASAWYSVVNFLGYTEPFSMTKRITALSPGVIPVDYITNSYFILSAAIEKLEGSKGLSSLLNRSIWAAGSSMHWMLKITAKTHKPTAQFRNMHASVGYAFEGVAR
jgi:hypothetical protein